MDSTHRQRVQDRWERRQFYTDEEDGSRAPLGWNEDEDDSENDDSESVRLPPSPRSRSSSKVRFQDDVTDNEYDTYDTRSNASSRSIPVAERWGGFEIPEAERDVGKEILYQVTQEGINELLNVLFKAKEDTMIEITRSRGIRRRYAREINEFVDGLPDDHPLKMDGKTVVDSDDKDTGKGHDLLALNQVEDSVPADGGSSNASEAGSQDMTRELPNGFTHLYDEASYSGSYSERIDSLRSEPEPDPTLPQNRPNTADLQSGLITPISRLGNTWELSNERPRLIRQNAEGSLSAGRSLTPEQALVQMASRPESSTSDVPMTSFELYPSRVSYDDHDDSIPQESSFSRIFDQSLRSSPQSFNPHSFSNTIPPLESGSSPSPRRSTLDNISFDASRGVDAPQSRAQLERLAKLNQAEREAERRGGNAAKLTFEEFAAKMQRERQLDFLMNWIDVTSF
ncbi:hypothetical protein KEM54_005103 [Ascosphaera aggregata]|nr:hypothetical protein KEM54_005103 [Ascosphaera aggregata]